jgi:hypothetical protein
MKEAFRQAIFIHNVRNCKSKMKYASFSTELSQATTANKVKDDTPPYLLRQIIVNITP